MFQEISKDVSHNIERRFLLSKSINKLILVRGISGSGKSTFSCVSPNIISLGDYYHLEADMFFMNNGKYEYDPALIGEAHEWCRMTTSIFLNNRENVVVSNTFTRKWEIQPYIDMANKLGIPVEIYRMTKEYGNIHGVPEEIVDKMRKRFENYPNEILV